MVIVAIMRTKVHLETSSQAIVWAGIEILLRHVPSSDDLLGSNVMLFPQLVIVVGRVAIGAGNPRCPKMTMV